MTSTAASTLRSSQRILSVPLARIPSSASHPVLKTFYHFRLHSPQVEKPRTPRPATENQSRWKWPDEGATKWIQTRAASTWAGFGKAKAGSWQLKVFKTGERLVDRVDFEEISLKTVDPSLGPTLLGGELSERDGRKMVDSKIPLLYPPSIQSPEEALAHLHALAVSRTPVHRKGALKWLIIAPFTAPFMIVPVIPNLPFFFCVWRAWSHYRAFKASEYLQRLIDQGALVPEPSETLDKIYESYPAPEHDLPSNQRPALLTRDAVPALLEAFQLEGAQAESDFYRALEQAQSRTYEKSSAWRWWPTWKM